MYDFEAERTIFDELTQPLEASFRQHEQRRQRRNGIIAAVATVAIGVAGFITLDRFIDAIPSHMPSIEEISNYGG